MRTALGMEGQHGGVGGEEILEGPRRRRRRGGPLAVMPVVPVIPVGGVGGDGRHEGEGERDEGREAAHGGLQT